MHAWHDEFYMRTVRVGKHDPIARFMIDAGVPVEDDVTKPDKTVVFSFPFQSPGGSANQV